MKPVYGDIYWDDPFYQKESDVIENPSLIAYFCRRIWKMFS